MDRFAQERPTLLAPFLRQMGAYFSQFEPYPDNLYSELIRIVRKMQINVTLVTTNYDLLIERAGYTFHKVKACYHLPPLAGAISVLKILEALKGKLAGLHSIRVNDQFRVCFRWTSDGPEDVEIVDYH